MAAGGFGFVRQVFGGYHAAAVFLGRCGQIKRGNAVRRAEFDNVFRTLGQGLHIQECALLRDDGDVFIVEIGFVFACPAAAFAQQFGAKSWRVGLGMVFLSEGAACRLLLGYLKNTKAACTWVLYKRWGAGCFSGFQAA